MLSPSPPPLQTSIFIWGKRACRFPVRVGIVFSPTLNPSFPPPPPPPPPPQLGSYTYRVSPSSSSPPPPKKKGESYLMSHSIHSVWFFLKCYNLCCCSQCTCTFGAPCPGKKGGGGREAVHLSTTTHTARTAGKKKLSPIFPPKNPIMSQKSDKKNPSPPPPSPLPHFLDLFNATST